VPEWSAELVVDAALARRLIERQFPEVDAGSLHLLGEGWDNTVWLVDERWVFRFPRRTIAVPAVERQVAILPGLARLLPLAIPEPAFAGWPSDGYPWPFFGAAFVPGREVADAELDDEERTRLARPLGEFLRALHDAEIPGAEVLPVDPMGRADMSFRVPRTRERLAELVEFGLWEPTAGVEALLGEAASLPPPRVAVLAHGDLHLRHLLVADGGASAVIDWDDLCRGDRSIDLVLVWCLLPPPARPEFLAAYGAASDEQLLRARVLALFLCGTLAVYARHEGLRRLEREAVAGLERTMSG
jgi:aminoglycoside phosphotransferase (APT) family kinase protein